MRRVFKSTPLQRQQGIALLQVLLISAIISILAIRFSITAREQVATSSAFEQRIKAAQLLKSTQNQIFYTLLTQNLTATDKLLFPNSETWNFYGQPFTLVEDNEYRAVLSIQDNAGLLSQQNSNSPYWRRVLLNLGYNEAEAKEIQGQLEDWQDSDSESWLIGNQEPVALPNGQRYRNQPIQLAQEIAWFFTKQSELAPLIQHISTPFPGAGINLLHAPDLLLSTFFSEDIAAELIQQRREGTLTKRDIINVLGDAYDDELVSFFAGNQFKIILQITLGEVTLQETVEIQIQARKTEPLLIFSRY
ncbi:Type II secretory pathway, component PulK [Colwellia chukchiensis]|uniref:Type II secretory pathway, component PulK n=1 Tax=Colwellia chukchiensis TaxID=641665 RepID=A0A1H7HA13_9GAMM|nr:type II secretion system protein GspK [Colwellia chukchiensis]SEK47058.1 Type II secretory pathway, component PulK [Colwellia chukchiensis]